MLTIGGLVFMLACVFGSYILAGGSMEPLLHSLPQSWLEMKRGELPIVECSHRTASIPSSRPSSAAWGGSSARSTGS